MEDQNKKEYHFLQEEIKKVPTNKKKFCKKLGVVILFAAVFGVVACLVFCSLKPVIEKRQEAKQQLDGLLQEDPDQTTTTPPEQVVVQEHVALTISEYEALQTQLYSIGRTVSKSVVEINSVTNDKDWFEDDFETTGQSSGIILEINSGEILILTEKDMIAEANDIQVTFYSNQTVPAYLKTYDGATGYAVIAVDVKDVSDNTKEDIQAIEMEENVQMRPGAFVIGIGSPQGDAFSVVAGNVTSTNQRVSFADRNCKIYATSMEAYDDTAGALVNVDGKLVGIICHSEDQESIKAISITELKGVLTKLKAGQRPGYLGVKISEVTMDVQEAYQLPDGIYIKSIDMNSPAVEAGLHVGDIIVAIDGKDMMTETQFENFMITAQPEQKLTMVVKRQGNGGYHDVTCKITLGVAE